MFTTLTTVGFGDYTPRSSFERILISICLLFGVSIFSYIMGEFMEMIDLQNDDLSDDANDLAKFFGILKKFNGEEDINIQFRI